MTFKGWTISPDKFRELKKKYDVVLPPIAVWETSPLAAGQTQDWGHKYLKAADVYARTRGDGSIIWILDTAGTTDHPDLIDRLEPDYCFVETGEAPEDGHGHGHHCAGIACATDNAIGVIGVAPAARLAFGKVLNNSGGGSYTWISNALRKVADMKLKGDHTGWRRIVSLSLGGAVPSSELEAAVNYALSKGVFIVAAAGNSYFQEGTDNVNYPGKYEQVITVSSIDSSEAPSSFSSAGPAVDVAGPGGAPGVLSCYRAKDGSNSYAVMQGTSMSTPHVSGLIALILAMQPGIKTQEQLEGFLEKNAKDIFQNGEDWRTGAGAPIATGYQGTPDPPKPEPPKTYETTADFRFNLHYAHSLVDSKVSVSRHGHTAKVTIRVRFGYSDTLPADDVIDTLRTLLNSLVVTPYSKKTLFSLRQIDQYNSAEKFSRYLVNRQNTSAADIAFDMFVNTRKYLPNYRIEQFSFDNGEETIVMTSQPSA